MTDREITLPVTFDMSSRATLHPVTCKKCGETWNPGGSPTYGLVEYALEFSLARQEAFKDLESLDLMLSLISALKPLSGSEQAGKKLRLTENQWNFLKLMSTPPSAIPQDMAYEIGSLLRAIYSAPTVPSLPSKQE